MRILSLVHVAIIASLASAASRPRRGSRPVKVRGLSVSSRTVEGNIFVHPSSNAQTQGIQTMQVECGSPENPFLTTFITSLKFRENSVVTPPITSVTGGTQKSQKKSAKKDKGSKLDSGKGKGGKGDSTKNSPKASAKGKGKGGPEAMNSKYSSGDPYPSGDGYYEGDDSSSGPSNELTPDEQQVLQETFRDVYNNLTFISCDGFFRTVYTASMTLTNQEQLGLGLDGSSSLSPYTAQVPTGTPSAATSIYVGMRRLTELTAQNELAMGSSRVLQAEGGGSTVSPGIAPTSPTTGAPITGSLTSAPTTGGPIVTSGSPSAPPVTVGPTTGAPAITGPTLSPGSPSAKPTTGAPISASSATVAPSTSLPPTPTISGPTTIAPITVGPSVTPGNPSASPTTAGNRTSSSARQSGGSGFWGAPDTYQDEPVGGDISTVPATTTTTIPSLTAAPFAAPVALNDLTAIYFVTLTATCRNCAVTPEVNFPLLMIPDYETTVPITPYSSTFISTAPPEDICTCPAGSDITTQRQRRLQGLYVPQPDAPTAADFIAAMNEAILQNPILTQRLIGIEQLVEPDYFNGENPQLGGQGSNNTTFGPTNSSETLFPTVAPLTRPPSTDFPTISPQTDAVSSGVATWGFRSTILMVVFGSCLISMLFMG